MIQGIEMERVVVTLLVFLDPPIDWVPMVSIPIYFEHRGTAYTVRTAPVSCHTIIIEAPALAAVMLNSRDLGILAQIGCVVHNKVCPQPPIADDSFNRHFLVRN
jgi:hypothetical protein